MAKSTKTLLNALFLLLLFTGFILIVNYSGQGSDILRVFPLFLVGFYSLMLMRSLTECYDSQVAEKKVNTIYLLGLGFASASLLTMFFRLKGVAGDVSENTAVAIALSFLFMTVTTSIASLLLRFLAWKLYVLDSRNPERYQNVAA